MKATRKRYSPEFKLRVALEALQEKETISVLAQRHRDDESNYLILCPLSTALPFSILGFWRDLSMTGKYK
jgi:hypothetical protein